MGVVVGAADYHHVEQELLDPQWRTYSESYHLRDGTLDYGDSAIF